MTRMLWSWNTILLFVVQAGQVHVPVPVTLQSVWSGQVRFMSLYLWRCRACGPGRSGSCPCTCDVAKRVVRAGQVHVPVPVTLQSMWSRQVRFMSLYLWHCRACGPGRSGSWPCCRGCGYTLAQRSSPGGLRRILAPSWPQRSRLRRGWSQGSAEAQAVLKNEKKFAQKHSTNS